MTDLFQLRVIGFVINLYSVEADEGQLLKWVEKLHQI